MVTGSNGFVNAHFNANKSEINYTVYEQKYNTLYIL